MNRCVNHPFDYCTLKTPLETGTAEHYCEGVDSMDYIATCAVILCPKDYRSCKHRKTPSKLFKVK